MKPIKGINLDNSPQEQPEGTYPFAKNGIQNDLDGSVFNEPGFLQMDAIVPYKHMGTIESDEKVILFSTDNTNSAIGYFNPKTELYEPIINDKPGSLLNWPADGTLLGFNVKYYITGQAQRNYKGEVVVAFTDKTTFPKYVNCDNPSISSVDDTRLFPYFKPPIILATQVVGGRVPAGAYYVAIGYERNDGTSSGYSAISPLVIITPGIVAGFSDKAINISIQNADTNYDSMRIAIIAKVDGKTTAVELLDFVPVTSGVIELTYTGDNQTKDIEINEILVPPALYNKVGTIGQLNDALYIAELQSEADLNDMQPYALDTKIEWVSELIDATAPPKDHINGIKKSLMHQEVYAVYIRYRKARGGFTKWFVTAGVTPTTAQLGISVLAATGGGPATVFKVEDTIPYFDPVTKTGSPGAWQNDTELYPDTADFGSYRGLPVTHHKMPSLKWCKANLYNSDDTYGKTSLDLLGLRAVNVRIPAQYTDIIDGYELGYAKRTVGNMTVYGQGIVMHGITTDNDAIETDPIYTSGGNFGTDIYARNNNSYDGVELNNLRLETFRFHAFDLLFSKPSIEPAFLSAQFKLRRNNLQTEGYLEDGFEDGTGTAPNQPTSHLIDYTLGETPRQIAASESLRSILNSYYLTGGINVSKFVNMRHEDCYAGILLGNNWTLNVGRAGLRIRGNDYTTQEEGSPGFEEGYLANLIANKLDIYTNFYSQQMVSAGNPRDLTDGSTFWGGDVFLCDYTFHTYGRHTSDDDFGEGAKGKKVIRRIVCESISNIHLRYEIPGNPYSKWYPRTAVTKNNIAQTYITTHDRSIDPNQFGYSKDFNALNDLVSSVIFNPYREEITNFPYRIHRGGKNSRQARARSWRTFLPLDYYECQKNMGRIIFVDGMNDRLLIHHENGLFVTQDKATLDAGTDGIGITLGSGDIFQFEPQPVDSSKLGYYGTQHDLACVLTPIGYSFVDAKMGEMYLYNGKSINLNVGVNTFLREYLKVFEKNNYVGNGITIGWDQKYKRILLTVKNLKRAGDTNPTIYEDTDEFWNNLEENDVIFYNGRYIKYVGINDNETYSCEETTVEPVYTWEKINPICAVNGDEENTGMLTWLYRRRLTNGTLDGLIEANLPNTGLGPYYPPIYDIDVCPLPAEVITWRGGEAYCEQTIDEETEVATPTGRLIYTTREKLVNGVPDGTSEANLEDADYIAPVDDSSQCLIVLPEGTLVCGSVVTGTYAEEDAYTFEPKTFGIETGEKVTIKITSTHRPNKFTVVKDGADTILNSGWIGRIDYTGPWGDPIDNVNSDGTFLYFEPEEGHTYTIIVEVAEANPDNVMSGLFRYEILCGI